MSNYIDSIIAEFREKFYADTPGDDGYCITDHDAKYKDLQQFLTQKLKEQEAMYEEAIGKHEILPNAEATPYLWAERNARNYLRKDIRQAVKKAKGEYVVV